MSTIFQDQDQSLNSILTPMKSVDNEKKNENEKNQLKINKIQSKVDYNSYN